MLSQNEEFNSSFENMASLLPKVNFKKIKLPAKEIFIKSLKPKNVTQISFSNEIISSIPEIQSKNLSDSSEEDKVNILSPLRKKSNEVKSEIKAEAEIKEVHSENLTFNYQAEVVTESNEDIILSPSVIPLPQLQKEEISLSGDDLVWPPKAEKKLSKSKLNKEKNKSKNLKKSKSKPYFIGSEQAEQPIEKNREKENEVNLFNDIKNNDVFPWIASHIDNVENQDESSGGLEAELLGLNKTLDEDINQQIFQNPSNELKKPIESEVITDIVEELKPPEFLEELENLNKSNFQEIKDEEVLSEEVFNKESNINDSDMPAKAIRSLPLQSSFSNTEYKTNNNTSTQNQNQSVELSNKGKGKTKLANNKGKTSPLVIIILGGATCTLGYLLWTNWKDYFLKNGYGGNDKVVVRNIYKKPLKNKLLKKKSKINKAEKVEEDNFSIKPITEEERLTLIQRAKEAIESRLDPFGQEAVLPPSTVDNLESDKKKEAPLQINIQRKQVELVGVVSAKEKNLALVNIYSVDFVVTEDDTEEKIEEELRKELGKANPNRIEVFVLDPVDEWYVKSVNRSNSRTEEPSIDLVKDDKKFRLKVGQKVLLPSEKTFEDLVEEAKAKKEEEEDLKAGLGLEN